eukprot:g1184.t1
MSSELTSPLSPTQKALKRFESKCKQVEARLETFKSLRNEVLNFEVDLLAASKIATPTRSTGNSEEEGKVSSILLVPNNIQVTPSIVKANVEDENSIDNSSSSSSMKETFALQTEKTEAALQEVAALRASLRTVLKRLEQVEKTVAINQKIIVSLSKDDEEFV